MGASSTPMENGYPVAVWYLYCPLNKMTGKPEFTYFKGMSGAQGFYSAICFCPVFKPNGATVGRRGHRSTQECLCVTRRFLRSTHANKHHAERESRVSCRRASRGIGAGIARNLPVTEPMSSLPREHSTISTPRLSARKALSYRLLEFDTVPDC